jgi:HemY protein
MRLLLLGLAVLLGSVLLTRLVLEDPGYLLLQYGHWTVETSVAVAVLLLALLYAALALVLRLLARLWSAPTRLRAWDQRRLRQRAQRALVRGLLDLAEGNWSEAERNLVRHVDAAETPLLGYLGAARAAQAQDAYDRRDRYLHLADECVPPADLAVGVTQAELQLAHRQHEQALATLMHLRQADPRHPHVLRLLAGLLEQLADWADLVDLLPELRRQRVLSARQLDELELRAQLGLLRDKARGDDSQLASHWEALPRALHGRPEMVDAYSSCLAERGEVAAAEVLLRQCLEHCWSPLLVERYGRLPAADPGRQLSSAEGWLVAHPGDATLLLTLGRLCLRARLWGKARSYLEASIGLGGSLRSTTYRELGALLEQMGEAEAALDCYRKGLLLLVVVGAAEEQQRPAPGPRGVPLAPVGESAAAAGRG